MSGPPSWRQWVPVVAFLGPGIVLVIFAPIFAVEDGVVFGVGAAVAGLGLLFCALVELKQLFVARVKWWGEQQIAELKRQAESDGSTES